MKKMFIFLLLVLTTISIEAQEKEVIEINRYYLDQFRLEKSQIDSITIATINIPTANPDEPDAYVDLGLSVKWAKCNLGATKPEGLGNCYAWGEINPKEKYDWSTYKWCVDCDSDAEDITTFTKYCSDWRIGYSNFEDHKYELEPEDDAATMTLGKPWRIPTPIEVDELINNCTFQRTKLNGVSGYKITGKNGNSIFLPDDGNLPPQEEEGGSYWTSWCDDEEQYWDATDFEFYPTNTLIIENCGRCWANWIRPVHP